MGALCSGPTPELSIEAELDEFESSGTGNLKNLEEALNSLRTGDLIFLRNGDRSSKGSSWVASGVAFYIPTKAYEEPLFLERGLEYDDALDDELSRTVVDSGLRLSNLRRRILRLHPGHSVYVRHLRAPETFTSTREVQREPQDAYLLSVARNLSRDSKTGLAAVQFLEAAKILPADQVESLDSPEVLSREKIPLVEDFEYAELTRLY